MEGVSPSQMGETRFLKRQFDKALGGVGRDLERARQVEGVFGDVGQDQVGRDGRDLVQPRFAEFALDVVLVCEAESAAELRQAFATFRSGKGVIHPP